MLVRSPTLTKRLSSVTRERLEPRQPHGRLDLADPARRLALDGSGDGRDVVGRGAAAAADQVDEAGLGELGDDRGSLVGRLVVLPERVGQAGVGVAGDERVGHARHLGDVGPHLLGAERAVEPDGQRRDVADRAPERLGDLAGQRAAARVGDGAGDDDGPAPAALLEDGLDREDGGLGVEGVEDGLDEEQVSAAVEQAVGRDRVRRDELVEAHVAGARVVDVGRDGCRPRGRPERPGDVPRLVRRLRRGLVGRPAGEPGRLEVELVGKLLHAVVGQGHRVGVEGVGLDDVGAGVEVLAMDRGDDVGLGEGEQVVVALEVGRPVGEALARGSPASDGRSRWIAVPIAPSITRIRSRRSAVSSSVASGRMSTGKAAPRVRSAGIPA